MNLHGPTEFELLPKLNTAREMLESGQVERARQLASDVLKAAQAQDDRAVQARALMALAQYDRVEGRFRRAIEASQRAVQLFQLDGDIASEATALAQMAHSCSILGRDEEAVESALLGVKLGDLLPPGAQQVAQYNYLGVSYLWSRSFANAEAALRESERLALLYPDDSDVLLPRTNLAWLEAMRLFQERYLSGKAPDTELLQQRLAECAALYDDDSPFPGLPGVRAVLQRFGRLSAALCLCWRGKLDSAREQLAAAQNASRLGLYAQVPDVIVHWARAEICWASGDLAGAERAATVLITQAGRAEFEQMAYIGHLLLTQIYKHRHEYGRALDEERAYRRRELRVRSDILDSRYKVVQTQLDIRTSERHLEQLARHAQELERLSFEDSLTSIANRRRFDQQLATALAGGVDPQNSLCVALIDIDDFKRINDQFSHSMGDDVLRSVAQAIRAAVRASDLPARIGGDEFVVLFPHTPIETARLVCERIGKKVGAIRWEQWPGELRVSVSIGVAQAMPADTAHELLKRSDAAMFEAKARTGKRGEPQAAG